MPEDYLEEANDFYEENNYDSALVNYLFIVNNYKGSVVFPMALYNTGVVYMDKKEYDRSLEIFNSIFRSSYNNTEFVYSDIMSNPYANFTYRSALNIGNIYYKKKDYSMALKYYKVADTVKYYDYYGDETIQVKNSLYLKIAKCYNKLKEYKKAAKILMPRIYYGLSPSRLLTEYFIKMLNKLYTKDKIKEDLNEALKNITMIKDEEDNSYHFITQLYGEEIIISSFDYETLNTLKTKEEAKAKLKSSPLFKYFLGD
jgi:tetratricopeptide (TPR) repeat protein